ncbi:predicted protein [Histoplasma capsulatum var. duboisii H88]|uniref:Predicted protein n=1 Tax=Ajellomyces capsulatus (strain H88) TaxID=544711 RepID=F0USL6_AJEC8|nr:predicted protein [Histoplasma capsulatum var. duboisii H88]
MTSFNPPDSRGLVCQKRPCWGLNEWLLAKKTTIEESPRQLPLAKPVWIEASHLLLLHLRLALLALLLSSAVRQSTFSGQRRLVTDFAPPHVSSCGQSQSGPIAADLCFTFRWASKVQTSPTPSTSSGASFMRLQLLRLFLFVKGISSCCSA